MVNRKERARKWRLDLLGEVQRILDRGKARCLLCRTGEPHFVGMFVPTDQRAALAPAGRVRGMAYTLCESCAAMPDAIGRVDRLAMTSLQELTGRPEVN